MSSLDDKDYFEDDGVVSATEMTGLISAMPETQEQKDEYQQIMRYKPGRKGNEKRSPNRK